MKNKKQADFYSENPGIVNYQIERKDLENKKFG